MTCEELISAYLETLKNGFACSDAGERRLSIVVPYLYPDHDNIELFVKDAGETVVVHDFGETLRRLDSVGIDFDSSERTAFQVGRLAKSYGLTIEDGILLKQGNKRDVGNLMFDVLSCCRSVADLVYASRAYAPLTFKVQVEKFLTSNGVNFDKHVERIGRFDTKYFIDFRAEYTGRVSYLQVQGARSKAGAHNWINQTFRMWTELPTAGVVSRNVSVLNDEEDVVTSGDLRLLESVSDVYQWSSQRLALIRAIKNDIPNQPQLAAPRT